MIKAGIGVCKIGDETIFSDQIGYTRVFQKNLYKKMRKSYSEKIISVKSKCYHCKLVRFKFFSAFGKFFLNLLI